MPQARPRGARIEEAVMAGRSAKGSRTQWTAQFLVAGELARRDYTVAFTMGNHTPVADLIVGHLPSGVQFFVKGLASPGSWLVELEGKPTTEGLYYILVLVGADREKDRFFVLSQAEARHLRDEHKRQRGGRGSLNPKGFMGFNFSDAFPYEKGCWERLPPHAPRQSSRPPK
jgi:hypothetical protein